jgi:adenine-specific DNA-methyltransferase
MADHYEDYTREQLVRLLRERDKRPRFGLVWERDEIGHGPSVNTTTDQSEIKQTDVSYW